MLRKVLLTSALAAAALFPSLASAQRTQETPGYAGEGMPYRDCSGGAAPADQSAISDGPLRADAAGSGGQISSLDAERNRQRLTTQLNEQIRRYDGILENMPPDYPNRADILFRKAQDLKEISDAEYQVEYAKFRECMNNWYTCGGDSECYEPLRDYRIPIANFRDIARNHPGYKRIDEVIFRLGELLIKNDQGSEGVTYLQNLARNYPKSIYLCEAHQLMGDHFFDRGILTAARQNYDDSLKFPTCDLRTYVLYKLAWVDINETLFDESLTKLQTVVSEIDNAKDKRNDLRNQALTDMLKCYSELPNGWQSARDYYEQRLGENDMRRKLTMLGGLFDTQGKHEERYALSGFFLERFGKEEKVPQWAEEQLDSLTKLGDWDRYEARAREFIALLDPRAAWTLGQPAGSRSLGNARQLAEGTLLGVINRNYQEAERLKTMPDAQHALVEEVAVDYAEFFRRFPDSKESYDQRFDFAELVYYKIVNGGKWSEKYWLPRDRFDVYLRQAGDLYKSVVEMKPDPKAEHAHDSAVGALQVYDDFMMREVPDISEPLPPPDKFKFVAEQALGTASKDYVDIVEWFAKLYPDDDLIPESSWRAASLYLRSGFVGEAAARFETIIEHHAKHRFAQEAGLAAFVCYQHVKNYGKIESVARTLLGTCKNNTALCKADQLKRNIAYAMDMQANEITDAGKKQEIDGDRRGALEQFVLAANKRVSLYREFPTSEFAAKALFSAAATFEQARDIDQSIKLYNEFLTAFDKSDIGAVLDTTIAADTKAAAVSDIRGMIPAAKYVLALIHDSQADFAKAADWFEKLDAYDTFEDRPVAILRAGRLREAMGQYDKAIALYNRYIALKPTSEEARNLYFVIAEVEMDRKSVDAAYAVYQRFIDTAGTDTVRKLVATYRQAEIRRNAGKMELALALYRQIYVMYGPGVLGFDKNGLPTEWTTAPGKNFPDENLRNTVLPLAAAARFYVADIAFNAAKAKDLKYREGKFERLAEKLAAQGEANTAAQKEMFEVMRLGDAQWAVAAGTRIGELYFDFYKKIGKVETFDVDTCMEKYRASYEQCDEAATKIDEKVYQMQEPLAGKAKDAFERAREISVKSRVYTTWTQRLLDQLHDIDRSNRLGGADGVVANKTADIYVATPYSLDLSDKLAAFGKYAEEQRLQQLQQQPPAKQ